MAVKSVLSKKRKHKGVVSLQSNEAALLHFGDANIAIIYQNIKYWCSQNEVNGRHFHDGRYWTYNSIEAFTIQFPFWTAAKIRGLLAKLEKEGWIKTGEYNTLPADRTKWYTDLNKKA